MQIFPDRLVFPRNFRFFNRLPARFEILVLGRGGETARGTVFELELAGQRLALPSKADLRVGARYELERISATEFRILKEISGEKKSTEAGAGAPAANTTSRLAQGAEYLAAHVAAGSSDLLAVKLIAEEGRIESPGVDKYAFDFSGEFPLRGVFVARSPGKYTLFFSGTAADQPAMEHFRYALRDFGVEAIRSVSADVLDRIGRGSIDMKT